MQILPPIPIGPSQFACPYCPVIMKTSKDTRRHILIHSGIKPFQCQFCPYSGTQKVHLKSHMANKHKDFVGIWFFIEMHLFCHEFQVFQAIFLNYRILLNPFIWGPNYLVVFTAQWLWKHPKILEDIFWYILELSHFLVNTVNIFPIEKIIWNPT